MAINLSQRVQKIKPSATLSIAAKASALKAEGKDIISLSLGEPDFETPDHIKEAAIKAIHEGKTKYTPVPGVPSLRQAIAEKFLRDNNLQYEADQILVSSGAKQSLYNLSEALLNEGDEVIIPTPYWVSYPDIILLAGAKPVIVNTDIHQQFKMTPSQLELAITDNTRLLFLNSPSNPTGVSYTKKELKALGDVLLDHPKVMIATDDIYEFILWSDEPFANILNACPELYDRTIVINGVSKAYAMTGWRIGYAAGHLDIIKAMTKIQSQSTSNPCSISQAAAEAAIKGDQTCVQTMLKTFKERHDIAFKKLNKIEGVECTPADGAFYLFPRVQKVIDRLPMIKDDVELGEFLLEKAQVAIVPGTAFGMPGYIRLSIALDTEDLIKAIDRIRKVM